MINRKNDHQPILVEAKKNWSDRARKGDDKLVEEVVEMIDSQYHPLGAIKGLKIIL